MKTIWNSKPYSGLDTLPEGHAGSDITEGCIVLEGGAFRGVYSAGVIDALMLANINMQCTIGVSAGAMNGLNYASGQIGRSIRLNLKYRHDKRYVGTTALRNNHGVIGFDFIFDEVNQEYPLDVDALNNPNRRFVAVATNCRTGKPEYFENGKCSDIFRAVQASASMPYVSEMVTIDHFPYLDGGCSNKIPYRWAMENGYRKIIVVRTRPDDYRKKVSYKYNTALHFYHDYPLFADALNRSNEEYNKQCDEILQLEKEGRLFVISPSKPVEISRLESDVEKLGALYYLGHEDTQRQLDLLRAYLGSDSAV